MTVQDRVDVASETAIRIPVILDPSERKIVWVDAGLKRNPRHVNNYEFREGNQQCIKLFF
jgi:hypothetical protein